MNANDLDDSSSQSSNKTTWRTVTKQTEKDRIMVSKRMEKNKELYAPMEKALSVILGGKCRMPEILAYARLIISRNRNLYLDRLMKRSKPVLICWFCEHIDEIPMLKSYVYAAQCSLNNPQNNPDDQNIIPDQNKVGPTIQPIPSNKPQHLMSIESLLNHH